ncbi:hypothetical protein [Nostoc sp.]
MLQRSQLKHRYSSVEVSVCSFYVSALLGLLKVVVFKSDRYPLL